MTNTNNSNWSIMPAISFSARRPASIQAFICMSPCELWLSKTLLVPRKFLGACQWVLSLSTHLWAVKQLISVRSGSPSGKLQVTLLITILHGFSKQTVSPT